MRLHKDMVRRGLIPEDKDLFNQRQINLWDLNRKDKKLWFREMTADIKCGKHRKDIETGWGQLSRR